MAVGCSLIASSAGVDAGTTVSVSCAGESTEPATGIVSDSVTGSSMTILLIGSVDCACGAHGADTARSAAAAGTVHFGCAAPKRPTQRGSGEDCSCKNSAFFHNLLPPCFR